MKRLRILHVGLIDNRKFSGVATVVPNYLRYQAEYSTVALLNLARYTPKDSSKIYKTYNYAEEDLESFLSSFNPDVVVFHEVYHVDFVKIAKILKHINIPYIITPHVSLTDTAQNHKWLKKRLGNLLLFNKFIKDAAAIHFLSESEKMQSSYFNTLPSFVCNNGIELRGRLKKTFSKTGLKLVYVGRYEIKIKGIDRILDAVNFSQNDMRKKNITVSLYGFDEANNLEWICATIDKYNISDIVTVDGPLFGDEKIKVILEHDMFIQLSRTEGQPLAIMEAMDIGMPCIVTEGTTFADVVRSNGLGFAVDGNPGEIGRAIIESIDHRESFKKMSKDASDYAESAFAWNRTAKRMIDSYSALAKEIW